MTQEIYCYGDLLEVLKQLSPEQLKQPIQVTVNPHGIAELFPVLGIGTVSGWEFSAARSSVDNKYHGDEVILLADENPFAEDGAIAYELNADSNLHSLGDLFSKDTPIYGKDGPTKREDQYAPTQEPNYSKYDAQIVKRRIEETKR